MPAAAGRRPHSRWRGLLLAVRPGRRVIEGATASLRAPLCLPWPLGTAETLGLEELVVVVKTEQRTKAKPQNLHNAAGELPQRQATRPAPRTVVKRRQRQLFKTVTVSTTYVGKLPDPQRRNKGQPRRLTPTQPVRKARQLAKRQGHAI